MSAEVPFLEAVKTMTDEELAQKRRSYFGRTDGISLTHSRAVCDEIVRRRRKAEQAPHN